MSRQLELWLSMIVPDYIHEQREEGLRLSPNTLKECANSRTDRSHYCHVSMTSLVISFSLEGYIAFRPLILV